MKRPRALVDLTLPWAGLVVGLLALGVVHQFGSDGTFDNCRAVSPGPLLAVAAIGLILCLASGVVSWRSSRASHSPALRLTGIISAGCAALFAFAILLAMIAAILLPPCFG